MYRDKIQKYIVERSSAVNTTVYYSGKTWMNILSYFVAESGE